MTDAPAPSSQLLSQLEQLPPERRLEAIAAHGPVEEVMLSLVDAAAELTSVEAGRAIEATGLVMALADNADQPLPRARARRARARALSYDGRFDEALAVSLEAVNIATQSDHPVEAGRARLASMHALGELGRLDEAIANGHQARELFERIGEPSMAARADINLGIAHQRQDQPHAALECLTRARPRLLEEPIMLGHLDNSRGEALVAINEFTEAEDAFTAALEVFENAGASLTAAIAEGNLADLAARQGRLPKALYYFERARRHLEEDQSRAHLARLLAEQAEAKAVLGVPAEALREYDEALHELDGCGAALEAARARYGMGLVYASLNRPAEAETALAAAATAFDELAHATARARVDLARAELALRNERTAEARRMATRALSALHDRPVDSAGARHVLARIALEDDDHELAEAELSAALTTARRLDSAPLLADILFTRGRLMLSQRRLDEAVKDLTEALGHIERIRGALQADRFRAAFLGDRSAVHEKLLGALLDRGEESAIADAFTVAEQAKSRSLLDDVRNALDVEEVADEETDDPAESRLRRELAQVKSQLNALYSRLADDRPADRDTTAWQEAVRAREQEMSAIEGRLAATRRTRWLYAPPVDLNATQAHLESGEALLEYFIADGSVMAFVVKSDDAVVCRNLAPTAKVADRLQRLQFQIDRALRPGADKGRRAARLLADARGELAELDALLLAPLRERVANRERLTIVPHGLLHAVPFHALWDGDRHLIESCELSYAPSASLRAHLTDAAAGESGDSESLVVGVADDVAPHIDEEARLVGRLLECSDDHLLVGEDATAGRVHELAAEASLIHFACHGRFMPGNPYGSGLRLADRWLTVRDIAAMRLRAELVTVSGCETALNLVNAGDELVGLLRSFFAAGVGSMLVSLWRVDDATTMDFMTRLYEFRNSPEQAPVGLATLLRRTQLALLAKQPHPALWAPFILVGRP